MHALLMSVGVLFGALTQSGPGAPSAGTGGSGGSGITALTGDVAASGTGSVAATLATVPLAKGGTGATTQQGALDAVAGAVTSGQVLRGNGTHISLSAIQAGDVPTLNQNTSGTAASFTGSLVGDVTGTQGATVVSGAASASSVFASSVAAGSAAYSLTEGALLELNAAATSYIKGDTTTHGIDMLSNATNSGSNSAYTLDTANALNSVTNLLIVKDHGTTVLTVTNGGEIKTSSSVTIPGGNTTSFQDTGSDKAPMIYQADIGFDNPFIHVGSTTLSSGAQTVTYGTAFAATPYACVCQDTTGTNVVQCSSTSTVLTLTGTSSDVIKYICIGKR